MFRLLKYAPVIIPLVSKFVKSPRGQRMIAQAKSRLGGTNGAPPAAGR